MSDGQNITGFVFAAVMAFINIILGVIVFPIKNEVKELSEKLGECQLRHSSNIKGNTRDIEYLRKDVVKAEQTTKTLTDCMTKVKSELSRIAFNTDLHSETIKELKTMMDDLPDRIVKKINGGGGKCSS